MVKIYQVIFFWINFRAVNADLILKFYLSTKLNKIDDNLVIIRVTYFHGLKISGSGSFFTLNNILIISRINYSFLITAYDAYFTAQYLYHNYFTHIG